MASASGGADAGVVCQREAAGHVMPLVSVQATLWVREVRRLLARVGAARPSGSMTTRRPPMTNPGPRATPAVTAATPAGYSPRPALATPWAWRTREVARAYGEAAAILRVIHTDDELVHTLDAADGVAPRVAWLDAGQRRLLEKAPGRGAALVADVRARLRRECTREMGVAARIGRTLEPSGCVSVTVEAGRFAAAIEDARGCAARPGRPGRGAERGGDGRLRRRAGDLPPAARRGVRPAARSLRGVGRKRLSAEQAAGGADVAVRPGYQPPDVLDLGAEAEAVRLCGERPTGDLDRRLGDAGPRAAARARPRRRGVPGGAAGAGPARRATGDDQRRARRSPGQQGHRLGPRARGARGQPRPRGAALRRLRRRGRRGRGQRHRSPTSWRRGAK